MGNQLGGAGHEALRDRNGEILVGTAVDTDHRHRAVRRGVGAEGELLNDKLEPQFLLTMLKNRLKELNVYCKDDLVKKIEADC